MRPKTFTKKDITYMSVPPPKLSNEETNSPPVRPNSCVDQMSPVTPLSNSASVEVRASQPSPDEERIPEGYEARKCFVNKYNGEVWFPAWDATGQVYYYQVRKGLGRESILVQFLILQEGGDAHWALPDAKSASLKPKSKSQKLITVIPEKEEPNMHVIDIRPKSPGGRQRRANKTASYIGGDKNILSNIQNLLSQFFTNRPPASDLVAKGIIKAPAVFGSTLCAISDSTNSNVPEFVKKCISVIESKDENMKTQGLYRHAGRLSFVQKIRFEVDKGNLDCINNADSVHVLTGALKLFFRELKEPLIPWGIVEKLMPILHLPNDKEKMETVKCIIQQMTAPHYDTLFILLKHLSNVTAYGDENMMTSNNLGIVFGPTLMLPPSTMNTMNIASNMVAQNKIVELLIANLESISIPSACPLID